MRTPDQPPPRIRPRRMRAWRYPRVAPRRSSDFSDTTPEGRAPSAREPPLPPGGRRVDHLVLVADVRRLGRVDDDAEQVEGRALQRVCGGGELAAVDQAGAR